jgi:hypothetical protein
MVKKRNYRKEYDEYQGRPDQIKERASRNKARREMIKAGKAHKGDGMDVAHLNNNELENDMSNLEMQTKHKNRAMNKREGRHIVRRKK